MNDNADRPLGSLRGLLTLTTVLVCSGWILSVFRHFRLIAWIALLAVAVSVWVARKTAGSWQSLGRELRAPLASWPVLIVLACIMASGALWPPTMLDSLTYRLPRLLLWLEAGGVYHVQSVETRLDFLCPVWEFITAPLVVAGGVRLAWLWGPISWLTCQVLFFHWASSSGNQDEAKSRSLALIANTSTFAVLQASSTANDLLAIVFACGSLHFLREFERHRQPASIYWAVLALALTTGTKPHFATLGLPFLAWLVLARSKPWQALAWRHVAWVLPVGLLCSAAPTFVLNLRTYGSWVGPARETRYAGTSPAVNVALGTFMMAWQSAQPCVNPLAFVLNEPLERFSKESRLTTAHPLFTLRIPPILMVDNASLGTITTVLFGLGLFRGLRRRDDQPGLKLERWTLAAAAFGFVAAVSQFMPSSVGRSFLGFLYLTVPTALAGWNQLGDRFQRWAAAVATSGALLALIVDPARPLWPAAWTHRLLVERGQSDLAKLLEPYLLVRERANAGRSLAERIPDPQARFVALLPENRPLLPILTTQGGVARVCFLKPHATLDDLLTTGVRFVIQVGPTSEAYPELTAALKVARDFELLASADYTSMLRQGPETWRLYRVLASAPTHTQVRVPSRLP